MSKKKTPAQFIQDARAVHGSRFEYLSEYTKATSKLKIFCNVCFNEFEQTANSHLGGQGCPKCARSNMFASRLRERDRCAAVFVSRAKRAHGDRYDYSATVYGKNCESKVLVTCRLHGEFAISPSNHLKGKGCPSCAKSGFDPDKTAYLYLLIGETPTHGEVIKVGITNVPKSRFAGNKKADQINWQMARLVRYPDGWLPQTFEKILIDYFGKPFKGKERFACGHAEAFRAFDAVTVSSRAC